jgi:hypothetical protein
MGAEVSTAPAANSAQLSDADVLVVFNLSEVERAIPLPSNAGSYTCLLSTGVWPQPRALEGEGWTVVALAPHTSAILSGSVGRTQRNLSTFHRPKLRRALAADDLSVDGRQRIGEGDTGWTRLNRARLMRPRLCRGKSVGLLNGSMTVTPV